MSKLKSSNNARPPRLFDDYEEYPEYVPVGEELVLLAKHWRRADVDLQRRLTGYGVGGRELRRHDYACDRIYGKIEPMLGSKELNRLIGEADRDFCAEWPAEERQVYLTGSSSERERLASQSFAEDDRLNIPDMEQVLEIIAAGTREHPIASKVIEQSLSLGEDQVWRTVQNSLLNDKIVCYDPVEMSLPADKRSPGQPAYWIPATQEEVDDWLEETPAALLRAMALLHGVVA